MKINLHLKDIEVEDFEGWTSKPCPCKSDDPCYDHPSAYELLKDMFSRIEDIEEKLKSLSK